MSTWMDTPSTSSPENSSPASSSSSSSSPLRGLASNATVAVAMAMNHSIPAGSSSSPGGSSAEMSARFNPSMAIIIVVLLGTFFFMGILSIYVKKCVTTEADLERHHIPIASWTIDHNPRWVSQRSSSGGLSSLLQIQQQQIHIQSQLGLDKASIQALPIVVAKPTAKNPNHECCVCLGEFQEQEFVRLLPGCGHFFHVECIDLWLLSHTTCPLCRFKLTPDNVQAAGATVLDVPHESLENLPQQHQAPESSRIRSAIARVWDFQRRARRGQESANSVRDDHQNHQDDHQHQQQQNHEQQPQDHQEISVSPGDALEQGGGIASVVDQPQLQECGDQEHQEHRHNLAALLLLQKVWNVFRCWKMGRLIASGRIFASSSSSGNSS